MSLVRVAPIVEGHGEYESVRTLISRVWSEILAGEYVDVLRPIRQPRSKLVREADLQRAVKLAAAKLASVVEPTDRGHILLLLDAHDDAPCQLGPRLLEWMTNAASRDAVSCVVANVEYETWFVGAAESLHEFLDRGPADSAIALPEQARAGKRWIETRFRGPKYSETIDQVRMTAAMDMTICRERCPSFDKLCRELARTFELDESAGA